MSAIGLPLTGFQFANPGLQLVNPLQQELQQLLVGGLLVGRLLRAEGGAA
jgi:hypothetical protein